VKIPLLPRLHNLRPTALPEWLKAFLLLSWLHMLWLTNGYVKLNPSTQGIGSYDLFHLSAWPLYSALYLLPVLVFVWPLARFGRTSQAVALGSSLVCLLMINADSMIYQLYGFHINGFVLNLVFTPGGLDSLGNGNQTYVSLALMVARLLAIQLVLLLVSQWLSRRHPQRQWNMRTTAVVGLLLFLIQGSAYGISDINRYGAVLDSAQVYPFFQKVRFRTLAGHLGFSATARDELKAEVDTSRLNYPLREMDYQAPQRKPNIVLLVAESLRWDQLSPEIMPNTWAFAGSNQNFTRHYSTGNGTREALFGLFYGLYGSYWENFLNARRGPLLMDRIQALGYALDIRTSARFSYPEFDKTLFASVPLSSLHEADSQLEPWQRDQRNTTELVDFLGHQKPHQPFFSFFFLESTHAGYSFPEEAAVRTPYLAELDYANLSLAKLKTQRGELINRYSNAAHWIDTQLGRIYRQLEQQGLLDNTIVVVTGDHGEEFLEHGAWGHNSSFVQQQTRVPLIVAMPGQPPAQREAVTSHMDIATTLLQTLGAQNDPGDFSLGQNLFDDSPRAFITLSDWHSISVLAKDFKYRIPYLNRGNTWSPTDTADQPLTPEKAARITADNRALILRAMANCTLFSRREQAGTPALQPL
jgi:uncharacterized protein